MQTVLILGIACLTGGTLGLIPEKYRNPDHYRNQIEHDVDLAAASRYNYGMNPKISEESRTQSIPIWRPAKIRDYGPTDVLCYPADLLENHPTCRCCGGWEIGRFGVECSTPIFQDCSAEYQKGRFRPINGRRHKTKGISSSHRV